jgi:uncharacterized protein YndB with AHSA1/START domain
MKWLKFALITLAAVILIPAAALAILNSRADANRLHYSVVIRKSPEAIWPWLYEPEKLKAWVSWLKDVHRDTQGNPVPGANFTWTMEDANNGNQAMTINGRVEASDPPRSLTVNLSSPGAFQGSATYKLTPSADGSTLLESDSRYDFENGFARFMMPLIMREARKKMDTDYSHLKSLVE